MNAALTHVAQRGLMCVDFDAVKATALAVWYGTEPPDLTELKGPHFVEVVQLVERLSYYNVVPQSRKRVLFGSARRPRRTRYGSFVAH
jgi:hypothetical protein